MGDEQRLHRQRRGEQAAIAHGNSQVLVTEIASSVQPDAATQS